MTAVRDAKAGARAGPLAGGGQYTAAARWSCPTARTALAQGRMAQSWRQRQGPGRAEHPAGRAAAGARARPASARCLERQHRDRLRHARCGRRDRRDDLPAGQCQPGTSRAARGLRCGGRGHRPDGVHRRRGPEGPRAGGLRAGPVLLRRPVQQPGQSRGAPRDDGTGDLVPDRRPDHPFRRGHGHHGNHDGHRRVPEGAEPGHHPGRRAARLALSWPRGV